MSLRACPNHSPCPGSTRPLRETLATLGCLAALLAPMNATADTCGEPDPDAPWALVFEENFDGDRLDRGRWDTEFLWGPSVIINNETQYYVNDGQFGYDPFRVNDGMLTISAIKTPFDRSQLYLTRSIYSASSAELLWRVPAGAVRYEIWRDGVLQGTASGGAFYQQDLREGIDYAYEVRAFDANDQFIVSSQLTVNTADRPPAPTPPSPFSLQLERRIYGENSAELIWLRPFRAARFNVLRDGELFRELVGRSYSSLYLAGLQAGERHNYEVIAYDDCDEVIIADQISIDTADGPTPNETADERLVVRDTIHSDSTLDLAWRAVDGAVSYRVTDNGIEVQSSGARSRFIDDMVPGVDRRFVVTAYDGDGRVIDETTRTLNTRDNSFALNRQPYLSGILTSYNSFRFRYGRVEARARMPAGKGLWSAFWLLNAYYLQDQPEDPEIDIIEAIGDQTTVANHAYHVRTDNDGDGFLTNTESQEFQATVADFSADFHRYRVDWEPGRIVWYIDDVETARVEGDSVSSEQMYLLLNLAVGGTFPGPADESTPFPAQFEIDYVRVWQRPAQGSDHGL